MRFPMTPMVKNLLIVNIGIFIVSIFCLINLRLDANLYFGLHSWYSENFKPWQFITNIFMHQYWDMQGIVFGHVFRNMLALFFFGPMLEMRWGARRFLFFYLFTGVCAGFLYWGINAYQTAQLKSAVETYLSNPNPDGFADLMRNYDKHNLQSNIDYIDKYSYEPNNPSLISETKQYAKDLFRSHAGFSLVGASGAIFGILLAFAMLFPNTEMFLLFIPFPIKAKYFVTFYGLYELYAGYQDNPGDNVAHFVHLAGMLFGFILVKYWQKQRNTFY